MKNKWSLQITRLLRNIGGRFLSPNGYPPSLSSGSHFKYLQQLCQTIGLLCNSHPFVQRGQGQSAGSKQVRLAGDGRSDETTRNIGFTHCQVTALAFPGGEKPRDKKQSFIRDERPVGLGVRLGP